ncbi:mechanosensitive ion channel family protein [Solimonas soli]|uniref:mechanosensitive ion channel family protein n=1 Tax=Solimonas soli TaxID=413479 RepID=UPI001FE0E881|nr:mechanosensitive ion channel family protein [Solimonas soli]
MVRPVDTDRTILMLEFEFLGNSLLRWLYAFIVAAAIVILVWAVRGLVVRRLGAIARRTTTSLDDSLIAVVRRTKLWLAGLPALLIASRSLVLPDKLDGGLARAAEIAVIVQLGLWLAALLDFWIARSRERAAAENPGATTSLGALAFVGKLVLWSMLTLVVLDNLGIDVTAMIAGLGVGGVAVALAVQNILGDLFASLSIVIDKPFVVGDFIIVDDYMGTVEHVGLKTTRLRSLGGEQLVFSNSDLLKSRLRNYKRMRERRVVFKFGILYETPVAKLEKIADQVREIVVAQPTVRFDRAHFASFGESSYDFEVVYWMLDPDFNKYMDTQQAINLAMVRKFEAEGIGFAYPTRMLHVGEPLRIRSANDPLQSTDAVTQRSESP